MERFVCPSITLMIMMIILFFTFCFITFASSLPFVLFHGFGDTCNGTGADDATEIAHVKKLLEKYSGAQGHCIEIGNGMLDSMFMPMKDQVTIACEKVKEKDELKAGYNVVASSQGNIISRGVIHLCDNAPPVRHCLVKNYISLAGPQAGIAALPDCELLTNPKVAKGCEIGQYLVTKLGAYDPFVLAHFAPSNYLKDPTEIEAYLKGNTFLSKISNEIESTRNSTYKKRFASLENLVLVKNEDDTILTPKETTWFGYYPNGSTSMALPANETLLYKEDWIGLRSLDEAGKVKFLIAPGEHVAYTSEFLQYVIAPYLSDKEPQQLATV